MTIDAGETPVRQRTAGRRTSKLKLLALEDIDRRTAAFRRTNELISAVSQDLGGEDQISASQGQLVQRGAVLGAVAEHIETQWLAGAEIDVSEYCTIINCQRRIFECVGLSRRCRDAMAPRPPSPAIAPLGDLLADRLAADGV